MKIEPIQFEAVKTALRQSRDGYTLSLVVHPDELPGDLMRDFVGSRYMVVMVRIGDDEQPINRDGDRAGEAAVKAAGILCRDPIFWDWLVARGEIEESEKSETSAIEFLHQYLSIESRTELKMDKEARSLFNKLRQTVEEWGAS